MTQHESLELCSATDSPVSFSFCVLLLSWFMVAVACQLLLYRDDGLDARSLNATLRVI